MQNNINKDEEVMRRSKSEITIKLLSYLKPYKASSLIVVLLMLFVMMCEIVNPLLLKIAIDNFVANKNVNGLIIIGGSLISLNLIAWIISLLLSLYFGKTSKPAISIILAQNTAPLTASITIWGAKNNPW